MAAVWDTTLASQIKPGSAAHTYCLARLEIGDPVVIAAGAVFETAHGYEVASARRRDFALLLDRFRDDVVGGAICRVLAMDGLGALVAGRLLATTVPPTSRKDRRPRALRRRAWLLDCQIAAMCWAAGHDVATANTTDFTAISRALANLYPFAPALAVEPQPF